ncbi:hypothetical protein LIPSTDRAFT_293622 [Lipomyces starkeyi NRRL Y-11557]|uniref:Uncharacterized protein n=1 Tax=Lipomyces starkeyi NRRL Y-11557 TaxID=675824 RepID=A0A1E3Q3Z5_LIPST|nr:hypothetical protein LIPSTDRAFT_293622 [Lipomyces starkeyi NRRL Y-11557]
MGTDEQDGLQELAVSLAFLTPCFTHRSMYSLAKMTEVFIDSTFGTNNHGYELYCVLTEYDLVSLPLSYLLLDTRGGGRQAGIQINCMDNGIAT